MTIPDAAIEAAAKAIYDRFNEGRKAPEWSKVEGDQRQAYLYDARAAIEAAMPAIREALAQEIEAIEVEWREELGTGMPVNYTLSPLHVQEKAARIVRGGAA